MVQAETKDFQIVGTCTVVNAGSEVLAGNGQCRNISSLFCCCPVACCGDTCHILLLHLPLPLPPHKVSFSYYHCTVARNSASRQGKAGPSVKNSLTWSLFYPKMFFSTLKRSRDTSILRS